MRKVGEVFILGIIIIMINVLKVYGIADSAGTKGMQFLKIGGDARGSSLGGAVIGDVEGIESLYWNPGGLNYMGEKEILITYNRWMSEMNYVYAGYGMPMLIKKLGSIGGSIMYMDEGEIDISGIEGIEGDRVYNICVSAGYGIKIKRISAGGVLRYIYRNILGEVSNGGVLDVGGMMDVIRGGRVGMVVKNLGFASAVGEKPDGMPIMWNIGFKYEYDRVKDNRVKGLIGLEVMSDNLPNINVGIEYIYKEVLGVRLGYKLGTGGNELGMSKGLSIGIGGRLRIMNILYSNIDISWLPYSDLGNTIMTSLKIKI